MNTTNINGCKIGKKSITDASGAKYPMHMSLGESIKTNGPMITIYAKNSMKGLPKALRPVNESDSREDYFENDKVRFYEGSAEFAALLPLC